MALGRQRQANQLRRWQLTQHRPDLATWDERWGRFWTRKGRIFSGFNGILVGFSGIYWDLDFRMKQIPGIKLWISWDLLGLKWDSHGIWFTL
jgi:hypothetical protein